MHRSKRKAVTHPSKHTHLMVRARVLEAEAAPVVTRYSCKNLSHTATSVQQS